MKRWWLFVLLAGLALVPASTRAQSTSLLDGLVAYWPLDETSGVREDVHGDWDLTDNNTVGYSDGVVSNAASFIYTNTESLSTSAVFNYWPFTVVAWIRPDGLYVSQRLLGTYIGDGGLLVNALSSSAATLRARYRVDDTVYAYADAFGLADTTWAMITVRVGDGIQICMNTSCSSVVYPQTGEFAIADAPGYMRIGVYASSSPVYWNGSIDETGVWNRLLTDAEIEALYNNGNGLPYAYFAYNAVPEIEHGDIDDVTDASNAILGEIAAGSVLPLLLGLVLGIGIVVMMLRVFRWL